MNTSIFPKGNPGPADYFSGTAWVNILVSKDETGTYTIGDVIFEPGCRNNWHTHYTGQILLITNGEGFYQERGKTAQSLKAGDVVVIASGIEHWHGARRDNSLTHIVITNNSTEGPVKWLQPVTNEEYNAAHAD